MVSVWTEGLAVRPLPITPQRACPLRRSRTRIARQEADWLSRWQELIRSVAAEPRQCDHLLDGVEELR